MSKENSITYEELSAEHKQKYDEIKALFEADLICSFERTRHHGIRGAHQSSTPGGELHGGSFVASALRESGEHF
jgi:hypothetical protein